MSTSSSDMYHMLLYDVLTCHHLLTKPLYSDSCFAVIYFLIFAKVSLKHIVVIIVNYLKISWCLHVSGLLNRPFIKIHYTVDSAIQRPNSDIFDRFLTVKIWLQSRLHGVSLPPLASRLKAMACCCRCLAKSSYTPGLIIIIFFLCQITLQFVNLPSLW